MEQTKRIPNNQVVSEMFRNQFESANSNNNSIVVDPNSQIKAVGMFFNFDKAERFWEKKYGIVIPTIDLQDVNGQRYDNGKWKAILQRDLFLNQVSRSYVVFPNEEVLEITENLLKDNPDLRMIGEPKFTNHGLNMYVTVISEKHKMKIDGSYEENDYVNMGVIIRNSLGGGLSLGTDIFTYRGLCENGAIFGYEEFGSDSMRHYGKNSAKITEIMRNKIADSLNHFEDIHVYYDKLASTPLGEKSSLFKKLEPYVPLKYYPKFVDIDLVKINKEDRPERVFSYGKDYNNTSLWQVFNDFTKGLWHSQDLRMDAKRDITRKLHQIVIDTSYKKYN